MPSRQGQRRKHVARRDRRRGLRSFKVRQMTSTVDTYVYDPEDEGGGGEIELDYE